MKKRLLPLLLVALLMVLGGSLFAQEFKNIPNTEPPITSWLTDPVTSTAHEVRKLTIFIALLITPYLLLPQGLLLYCIFKFREGGGRKPATFHENLKLEIFWTVLPTLTLMVIALPSYFTIKFMETIPKDVGERVVIEGHQFFWVYQYPEYNVTISNEALIVPVNSNIACDITSVDVIHSWWVPSFAVKMDAVPGRTNQIWFNVEKEGWYKGQCAELCGALHSKMLIDVKVVSQEEFDQWMKKKIEESKMVGGTEGEAEEDAKPTAEVQAANFAPVAAEVNA